jgi:hypothetical protein
MTVQPEHRSTPLFSPLPFPGRSPFGETAGSQAGHRAAHGGRGPVWPGCGPPGGLAGQRVHSWDDRGSGRWGACRWLDI